MIADFQGCLCVLAYLGIRIIEFRFLKCCIRFFRFIFWLNFLFSCFIAKGCMHLNIFYGSGPAELLNSLLTRPSLLNRQFKKLPFLKDKLSRGIFFRTVENLHLGSQHVNYISDLSTLLEKWTTLTMYNLIPILCYNV